jgi:tRNA threonylcarbamoyladenosine biosynthesis protein TsaB
MTYKIPILTVETSSRIGSVAVAIGRTLLTEASFSAPLKHSAEIFPTIQCLLKQCHLEPQQIQHIYISVGPGSFTGLRIAVSIAKTMHLANAVKVVAVDTLDVIAANVIDFTTTDPTACLSAPATNCEIVAPIVDAKRGQFFTAIYKRTSQDAQATSQGVWKKTIPDSLMTASQFLDKAAREKKPVWLLGDGLLYHKDKFESGATRFFAEEYWSPNAAKVHLLGWQKAQAGHFADPVTLTPFYLRAPQVTKRTI